MHCNKLDKDWKPRPVVYMISSQNMVQLLQVLVLPWAAVM